MTNRTFASCGLATLAVILSAACGPKSQTTGGPVGTAASAGTAAKRIDVPPLKVDWTPAEIATACDAAETKLDAELAKLVAIPAEKRTFANTVGALEWTTAAYGEAVARLTFMKDIHTDPKVREAGSACEERAGKYFVKLGARKDLYLALKAWQEGPGKKETLGPQQKRLVEITMRDFRRNGLELPDEKREKLVQIRSRLAELSTQYASRLGEDKTTFEVAIADLEGLPRDWIERHEKSKDGKKVVLSTKYPDYYPVMENAKKESVRRKMELAFMNRGGVENVKLLDEAIKLRTEASKILGYATHADFVAEPRMARDAKTIETFLARMRKGLRPALQADAEKMRLLKVAETKDENAKINAWDWRYFMKRIKERDHAIDDEQIRQYFPLEKVMAGMFEVYERLFSIRMVEVKDAKVWADQGVKLYEVRDVPSNALVAKFYVDMFPRDGKYGHAAEFTITQGHEVEGGYRIPQVVLVTNFQPPAEGKPSYLNLNEVDTLFHEFGHVVHDCLTTAKYPSLAGTNTARDFVEAPSQMLENWVYQPEVLALISQDPNDPKKAIPEALAKKIVAARRYDAGVHYSRQVFLGAFDYEIHTGKASDADAAAKRLWADILGFNEDKEAHFAGVFGHMMGGYDGGYYGYLWSEVFAADMFTRFEKEGVLNPKVGRAYRDSVLAKGRTVEADELLKEFLGREPNEEAFLKQLGIKSQS